LRGLQALFGRWGMTPSQFARHIVRIDRTCRHIEQGREHTLLHQGCLARTIRSGDDQQPPLDRFYLVPAP
jgi:hypothetical protein